MADSLHLGLPYIAAAQAQKHVTHNEALRALDALVMLAVIDRDLTAPPGSPAEGARYLVKATGTGGFAGKDGQIAHFRDGAWAFHIPRAGWIAYVADEEVLVVHNGTTWEPLPGGISSLQDVPLFGLATIADTTNPISAVLNNALFAARTVADGGDGDLRYKLSKATAGDTVSLLLQDNFSGRAEIGLAGDDDLHLKVSSDGTTWREGLVIAASTGKVSFPQGATGLREKLTANRTYYVRSDGSDSQDGLTNSAGGAFLTIQKAIDTIAQLDIGTYNVTIQLAASTTYTENILVNGPWLGSGTVTLLGASSTTTIVTSSSNDTIRVINNGSLTVSTFEVRSASVALRAESGGHLIVGASMRFGAAANYQIYAESGGNVFGRSAYTIAGNAGVHLYAAIAGVIDIAGITITLSGTPAFTGAYAVAERLSIIQHHANTFSGSATGARYTVSGNSIIFVNGGGASYLPGNSAGSTATGGQYI